MTEAEWRDGVDLPRLLAAVEPTGQDRKLRLFACACVRRVGHPAGSYLARALEVAERFAEGMASAREREAAQMEGYRALREVPLAASPAFAAGVAVVLERAAEAARYSARNAEIARFPAGAPHRRRLSEAERRHQRALLRCVFPRPGEAVAFEERWRTPTVLDLARAAYDERLLPEGALAADRLAVLADAVEEAGCEGATLAHLREPGPHVRGCRALDVIFQKNG